MIGARLGPAFTSARARTIVGSEAHLQSSQKAQVFVREIRRVKRSRLGWFVFWTILLLNEARGLYFARQIWASLAG